MNQNFDFVGSEDKPALIAFSTPAQNPLGSASSTRSTLTGPGYRGPMSRPTRLPSGGMGGPGSLVACRRPE